MTLGLIGRLSFYRSNVWFLSIIDPITYFLDAFLDRTAN